MYVHPPLHFYVDLYIHMQNVNIQIKYIIKNIEMEITDINKSNPITKHIKKTNQTTIESYYG